MWNSARRLVALSVAALALGAAGHAQGPPKELADLEKQIGLTDVQRKKMEALDKKYQPKFLAIKKKYQPQFEVIQKQAMQLQQKMNAEGKPTFDAMNKEKESVLTPAQVTKMKAILAKFAARNKKGGG